jgi:hypothetical protein
MKILKLFFGKINDLFYTLFVERVYNLQPVIGIAYRNNNIENIYGYLIYKFKSIENEMIYVVIQNSERIECSKVRKIKDEQLAKYILSDKLQCIANVLRDAL